MTARVSEPVQQIAEELDAEYVGVGRSGILYRAPGRRRCYRVIPSAELSAEKRAELRSWQDRPRRSGLAPVVSAGADADQRPLAGHWYQVVCYDTGARRSLSDVIAAPEPALRVDNVVAALRAVPRWWESLGPGMMPMPADIMFTDAGPQLLPLPCWGGPSLTELLASPERVLHLAPTVLRGHAEVGRTEDLFALAVAALRCFGTSPETDSERLLHRAACAVAPAGERLEGRLPVWMRRVAPIRAVLDELGELTSSAAVAADRGDADVSRLVERLQAARDAMDPVTAVQSLRDGRKPDQALALARTILVDDPHYDVLVLAANIAYTDASAPLEALTLLDRAVQVDPDRTEAYTEQISVIGDLWMAVLALLTDAIDDSFTHRLDTTIQTAFRRLPPSLRRDHAPAMTGHLIRQGQLRKANAFAHRWLFEGERLLWWRFDLILAYAMTFLLLGRIDEAEHLASLVRDGLRRVTKNRSMDGARIHEHGQRLAQFEAELRRARDEQDEPEDAGNGTEETGEEA